MILKRWWRSKTAKNKTITLLATLLILETGLCFSTPFTVEPVYETLFGPSHDSDLALGLEMWQFFLWGITLAVLGAVALFGHLDLYSDETDEEKHD